MLILQSRIYRVDLRANPSVTYVFGDNAERWGRGGQAAEMRDEPNAIGIATLTAPGRFWSDADLQDNCDIIDADMEPLFEALREGRTVVFPIDGVGTGLARLGESAPSTFRHLQNRISELKHIGGQS
jgi:hypothetical protein